ncbi:MAG: flavin reductase, partial [Firmicutes bacterium]|nr:flavin reductase [Bacillota bacterium]
MNITKDIRYVGVNDHKIDLFEGHFDVPLGMAYNSYVIVDEKIAIMDTVDKNFTHEWLDNVRDAIGSRKPDYLIVQHMEPDHSANIFNFLKAYPDATVVGNAKTFGMIEQFFGKKPDKTLVVANGDQLVLGKHYLNFVFAPMVHWPEVMVTYDATDRVLFSADGFGKFGANDVEDPEGWDCEARRYYFGIVGKYGPQVQNLLAAASTLSIDVICSLHGPVLKGEEVAHAIAQYNTWSSYEPETEGVFIAYTSVYGNTKAAVELLAQKLREKGCPRVVVADLAREDMYECVEDAFRHNKLVLATTTYNAGIFPYMREFIGHLTERGFRKRTVGLIENGSWAPMAAKVMKGMLENSKDIRWLETTVTVKSALNDASREAIEKMAEELCVDYVAQSPEKANKQDFKALYKIGYGLYVITTNDGRKDNGMICNTVAQVADNPKMISVTINKQNYSCHTIDQTKKLNVNCLSVDAPFEVFKHFGFQSGRTVD